MTPLQPIVLDRPRLLAQVQKTNNRFLQLGFFHELKILESLFFSWSLHNHCEINTSGSKMAIQLTNKISIVNISINGRNTFFRHYTICWCIPHTSLRIIIAQSYSQLCVTLIRDATTWPHSTEHHSTLHNLKNPHINKSTLEQIHIFNKSPYVDTST